jgi:hypothetical protein
MHRKTQVMMNTLGLDDDLDTVEVVLNLETSFGIRFTDAEIGAWRTVGDIYSTLRSRVSNLGNRAGRCATAMTFHRLRRAGLPEMSIDARLRPDTPVKGLTALTTKALFKQISAVSGLRMPRPKVALWGTLGMWSILASFIGLTTIAVFAPHWWPIPMLAAALGIMLYQLDPGEIPPDCRTLGDLSRKVTGLNFGMLSNEGAELHDKDLWNALVEVLSEDALLPKLEIRPETLLLQKQLRSA